MGKTGFVPIESCQPHDQVLPLMIRFQPKLKIKLISFKSLTGFMLTELLISVLLFSVLASTLYSLMSLSHIIVRTHDVRTRMSFDGMQLLRTLAREIGQTSYTTDRLVITLDGSNNSIVRFQIPVDYDDDGDVVSSSLTKSVEWGAYDNFGETQKGAYGTNPLSRWVRYSVVSGQLIREVLTSVLVLESSKVIHNDVQSFSVTQNGTVLTLVSTLSVSDTAGQAGASRTLTETFNHRINLSNAPT